LEWEKATYGMAVCAQQTMPASKLTIGEAQSLFEELRTKTPKSVFAPRATMNLGRIAELRNYEGFQIDLAKARGYYQQVMDTWPEQDIAGEAALRCGATYVIGSEHGVEHKPEATPAEVEALNKDEARKGVKVILDWLALKEKKGQKEVLASAMWQYLGDTYFCPLEQYKESLAAYEQCDKLGWAQAGRQGAIYWRMAVMAEQRVVPMDREAAVKFYTKSIKETPTYGMGYESQIALRRLGAPVPEIHLLPVEGATKPAPEAASGGHAQATGAGGGKVIYE